MLSGINFNINKGKTPTILHCQVITNADWARVLDRPQEEEVNTDNVSFCDKDPDRYHRVTTLPMFHPVNFPKLLLIVMS